ncbi:MAG: ATP-binding cassette domain-containing protein [Thermoguttaceae bacterium]|nr:ATP-binding cassette domain-containing protein [Thermoguttaceae bacterium]
MSFITIENVHKTYKTGASEVHALNGVSLQIEKGEHVAIMGKSGSGKSTLLHVLAGLTRFDSGTISIDGNSVSAMSDAALTRFRREKIGLIFQAFNLIPTLTAEENILLPLIAGGKTDFDKDRLEMLLTHLEIADRRSHRPDALSGGEQQRAPWRRTLRGCPSAWGATC